MNQVFLLQLFFWGKKTQIECVSDAAGGRKQKVADEKRVVSISTIKKNYLIKSSSLFHLSFFQLELASFFNVIIF